MNKMNETLNKKYEPGEDDDLFDDSSLMANFENNSFKDGSNISKSVINDSLSNSNNSLNISALCCDEEINGYDRLTGKTWIYPTNYPVRDYQFNIIKAALLKNTLVSLPTGLGKTFIAAVIMYNFYRWYPLGKIVFTAPTRPLVAQQIDACYNIIAIPPKDTVEMTGHMQVSTRKLYWQNKRVFFATPQVIYNDMISGICPADRLRCLVVDEAHRARGNYAYCQIVAALTEMKHNTYRLLALSATPGSKVDDVINVVKHLNIAHLELRTENCIDVAPYSHARKINTVVVQLGPELTQLRNQYIEILDGYARRLKQMNILPHNIGNMSKGRIVMLYKEYQGKERGNRHPQHNYIMKDFTLLIALYHGLELLVKHGSRVFLNFFDDHPEKSWIQSDDRLTGLLERLRDDLGVNPMSLNTSVLPDGSIPDIPKNLHFGHPKFDRLKEIVLEHFQAAKRNKQVTKAIVFCEYRESVNLVHCLLLQCRPLVSPQMFVGQGASGKDGKPVVSQKQQLHVMRQFREGACDVLVATCVCEEGLDVGSVDLIVCFDTTASPVRLVQRCGRTGRERGGKVFILVTEGREHQTLMECMRRRDGLNAKILQSKEVASNLYKANPRMMPRDVTPTCQKMFITVARNNDTKKNDDKTKSNQKDLRSMFGASASTSRPVVTENDSFITKSEFDEIFPAGYKETDLLPDPKEVWSMKKEIFKQQNEEGKLNLSSWLEWQRNLQDAVRVGHSTDTETLVALLQYSDARRFELPPSTQNPTFSTQLLATQNFAAPSPEKPKPPKKTKKAPVVKSPTKKSGDIRALFSTATKSTKNYTKLISELGIKNDGSIPTSLVNLLVELSLDNATERTCYICQNICDCKYIENIKKHRRKAVKPLILSNLTLPDIDLIDDLDVESLVVCQTKETNINNSQDLFEDFKDSTYIEASKNNCSNFDLEFDFGSPNEVVSPGDKVVKTDENPDKNFDLGDIEDIFADSSPEEATSKEVEAKNSSNPNEALGFFGLGSIEDIFVESDESKLEAPSIKENKTDIADISTHYGISKVDELKEKENYVEIMNPPSPSILSGQTIMSKKQETSPTSPILCSQVRKFQLSTKRNQPKNSTPLGNIKRQLIPPTPSSSSIMTGSNKNELVAENSTIHGNSTINATNKSMFTITQLVEMINKNEASTSKPSFSKSAENPKVHADDDRCTSPILLSQAVRRKTGESLNKSLKNHNIDSLDKKVEKQVDSLIVLGSDSDCNENDATQMYDIADFENDSDFEQSQVKEPCRSPLSNKRKLDTDDDVQLMSSPYFNKRPKLDNNKKPLTLQEKVLAALNRSEKPSDKNHDSIVNFTFSQKENKDPVDNVISPKSDEDDKEKCSGRMNLSMLQAFRRDSQVKNPKRLFQNSPIRKVSPQKRKSLDDSDDDFVMDDRRKSLKSVPSRDTHKSTIGHKVRKKKPSSFIELEAEDSDAAEGSDDERSDGSVGSIVEFICDDEPVCHEDMRGHYMRSVTGTINGAFKIPELPAKFRREEILSQFVEEDSYEMDSFCVDSHIGLTQVNDISELELAEIILEERKTKKKSKSQPCPADKTKNDDSPLIIRKKKSAKRQIQSDSDDSS